MISIDLLLGVVGFVLTLMVFSYIFGDNVFFRVALTILVGVSAGFTTAVMISKVLIPLLINPLGSAVGWGWVWATVPLLLTILVALMLVPRLSHMGKVPLAFLAGVFAALTVFGVVRGTIAPQLLAITNQFSPQLLQDVGQPDWGRIVWAVMVLLGVIAVMVSFQQFTRKGNHGTTHPSLFDGINSIGQIFIGITLGAVFVTVFSTGLIALISRMTWLMNFVRELL